MIKKIVVLLSFVIVALSLFVINSNTTYAWTADDAMIYNTVIEDNQLKSFKLRFTVPSNLGESTSWVGIQEKQFDEGNPDSNIYGDLTDSGTVYNRNYRDTNAVIADNEFVSEYGIAGFNKDGFPCFGNHSIIATTVSNLSISLSKNKTYYIYLWTYYNGRFYPDARIATIEINDGLISAADRTGNEINIDEKNIIDRIDVEGTNLSLKVGSKPSFTSRIKENADKLNLTETFMAIDRSSWFSTDEESSGDSDGLVKDYKYFHILDIDIKDDNYIFGENIKVYINGVEKKISYISPSGISMVVSNESELITPEEYVEPAILPDDFIEEQNNIINSILIQAIKDGKVKYDSDYTKSIIDDAIESGQEITVELAVGEAISKSRIHSFFDEDVIEGLNSKIGLGQKIGAYYSVGILVYVDGYITGTIEELESPITVILPTPNGLPKLSKGYKRVWKVIRYHNGETVVLDATQTKDGISFENNMFSDFALVYEDVKTTEDVNELSNVKTNNPNTRDNILIFACLTTISVVGIIIVLLILAKNKKQKIIRH